MFRCVIVTPEEQSFDQDVKQVIIPAHDGEMGILTDRAPILVKLGLGALTVDTADGKRKSFFVDGGVAQMKENVLTIATTEATPVEELDARQAETELADATAARISEKLPADLRERSIRRAKTKMALARK
jgi:F-type H+-transporting ATPase subunit epsilon